MKNFWIVSFEFDNDADHFEARGPGGCGCLVGIVAVAFLLGVILL